jgi:hypothetical protein
MSNKRAAARVERSSSPRSTRQVAVFLGVPDWKVRHHLRYERNFRREFEPACIDGRLVWHQHSVAELVRVLTTARVRMPKVTHEMHKELSLELAQFERILGLI